MTSTANIDQARADALDAFLTSQNAAAAKGATAPMFTENSRPLAVDVIPTGATELDIALGVGGLPRGRIVEIYGPEGSGKTSLALSVSGQAIKAGGSAGFVDAEHAINFEHARWLGVDTNYFVVNQPDFGEQALQQAEAMCKSGLFSVVTVDSVASLVPKAELDGDIGDQFMGLQARMMSQALRRLQTVASNTGTTLIFINQLREKIGVMFGCFEYNTRVQLADGTSEKIGKIVNRKLDVEVLTYNPETDRIEPQRVLNWYKNGRAEEFLQFTAASTNGNGKTQFAATANHQISTPDGWESAGDLKVGDSILVATTVALSAEQMDAVRGMVMGDGCLDTRDGSTATALRLGHGIKQKSYLDWKLSMLSNLESGRHTNKRGTAVFADFRELDELYPLFVDVYRNKKKHFTQEYLESLSPLAWAIWYMDDGSLAIRSKGKTFKTPNQSGRISFCVQAMDNAARQNIVDVLTRKFGITPRLKVTSGKSYLIFNRKETDMFLDLVYQHVHPSMDYKLLPYQRGAFVDKTMPFIEPYQTVRASVIRDIHVKPRGTSMQKYDIEVANNHNYLVDGALVHNSPETQPGGKALKFFSSVRLDVRAPAGEQIKSGTGNSQSVIGQRCKIKVVKNKVAPPFRKAEYNLMYGQGIDEADGLISGALHLGIWTMKPGGTYLNTATEEVIGRGRDNIIAELQTNDTLRESLRQQVTDTLLAARTFPATDDEADADDMPDVDIEAVAS